MKLRKGKPPPAPVMPLKARAKDLEIDRLIEQAQQLTGQLRETVDRIGETLRTHRMINGEGEDGPAGPGTPPGAG